MAESLPMEFILWKYTRKLPMDYSQLWRSFERVVDFFKTHYQIHLHSPCQSTINSRIYCTSET